jgi:maltooligosyltrehalose trehalohydrolase
MWITTVLVQTVITWLISALISRTSTRRRVSRGDPSLVDAVRRGRKGEFADFGCAGHIPDSQSQTTFLDSKLNWDLQAVGNHRILWHFDQEPLRIRRTLPPLAELDKNAMEVTSFADEKAPLIRR